MSNNTSKGSIGLMTQPSQLMLIGRSRGQAPVVSKHARADAIPKTKPELVSETLEKIIP